MTAPIDCSEHLGLAWSIVRKWQRKQRMLDADELLSIASLALVTSAAAFDPARGCKFSTFAIPRINGAIMDEMRRLSTHGRSKRPRALSVRVSLSDDDAPDLIAPDETPWARLDALIDTLPPERARLARLIVYKGAGLEELIQAFPQWTPKTLLVYRSQVRTAIRAFIKEVA